jgi:hypothetical protein
MSDKRNENTDKKGTCVYEKDIHVSHKGQGAATYREKGQGVTRTRADAARFEQLFHVYIVAPPI